MFSRPNENVGSKNIDKCILEIEEYKKILKEIARYSKKEGVIRLDWKFVAKETLTYT